MTVRLSPWYPTSELVSELVSTSFVQLLCFSSCVFSTICSSARSTILDATHLYLAQEKVLVISLPSFHFSPFFSLFSLFFFFFFPLFFPFFPPSFFSFFFLLLFSPSFFSFFFLLLDPIPTPEERLIWSQSSFVFSFVWVLALFRRIVRVSDHA